MRILTLMNHFAAGGAAAVAADYLRYLHLHTPHEVEICTLYTLGGMGEPLRDLGIPVHDFARNPALGQVSGGAGKYDPRLIRQIAALIRRGRYDVVHVHTFPSSLFTAAASLIAPKPVYVFSEHNAYNRRRDQPLLKPLDQFIYSRYHAVIGVSQAATDALIDYLPSLKSKAYTIPNAIDPARYRLPDAERAAARAELGLTPDEVMIFWAGRLEHVKGIDVLLEAVRCVRPELPQMRVLLAGGGTQSDAIQVSAADLHAHVRFLGFRSDMPKLLAAADICVLPSRWEGLPISLLEAMAASKPMIASAVGGVPEVIDHARTGWLIPPDDVNALADALRTLIASPDVRAQVGTAARAEVEAHYALETCVERLIHIYESVIHA